MRQMQMIRKARISDIRSIHAVLSDNAARGILLGRSLSDLYDQIRDFFVFEIDSSEPFAGTCGLHICWEDIAEIRSLAVRDGYLGRGIGRDLVGACIDEAREIGIKRLFVLTYVPDFFKKLGFYAVDKSVLPHKVWADCIKCVKFPDCDEEALMMDM